jgi:hypothetical protein
MQTKVSLLPVISTHAVLLRDVTFTDRACHVNFGESLNVFPQED